jgi:Sulfotransferase domain
MARLPDFIVVGVRKCGTTWLHRCLQEHPQIQMPAATKELFFFDRHWRRGPDWYSGYFRGCPPERVCGEISPSYFAHASAPARIARVVPQARLMFLLRDPVARAVSAYRDMLAKGDTRLGFSDALNAYPQLIDEGRYARHLARYAGLFAASAMHIVLAEDVRAGGDNALSGVYGFFGVRQDFRAPSLFRRVNEARVPRSPRLAAVATKAARALHHAGLHRVVALARAAGARHLVSRRSTETFAVSAQVLAWLDDMYARDIEDLGALMNRNLRLIWPGVEAARHRDGREA